MPRRSNAIVRVGLTRLSRQFRVGLTRSDGKPCARVGLTRSGDPSRPRRSNAIEVNASGQFRAEVRGSISRSRPIRSKMPRTSARDRAIFSNAPAQAAAPVRVATQTTLTRPETGSVDVARPFDAKARCGKPCFVYGRGPGSAYNNPHRGNVGYAADCGGAGGGRSMASRVERKLAAIWPPTWSAIAG